MLIRGKNRLLDKIFKGDSPFDDGGTLEVIEGFPKGVEIPNMSEASTGIFSGLGCRFNELGKEIIKDPTS